ncbi:MAG: xylulose kinase [Chloroflexota bacterium]|nr:MAG: xylulose kinase [Chloroflexota bacterium]
MAKKYLIGADLGTSATKAALYQTDGTLVAEASAEVPIYYPRPGVVEQENDDFYLTAAKTIGQCISASGIDPRQVLAIAFDSQMAGVGSVDEAYRPATRFDSWLDMRCQPYIEEMDRQHGDLVTRLTGCAPTCDHGPKMLWWKEERPAEYARTRKFLMPAGYVAGKMAGIRGDQAFIDYTFIHFSGFSDAQNGIWSSQLCDLFGLDIDKLPEIVEPWRVIGQVTDQAAQEFGLAPGTAIAAGCGDTAANALGAGIVKAGMVFDVAGTASVLAGCTNAFVADVENRALLTMRSVIPGLWNPLAYIAGGGQALRWYRDTFFDSELGEAPAPTEDELYKEMAALARNVPAGSDGLFFSPHLGGRICPATPEMRGAWIGFSWGHTQAHFYRAILESVAYEYAYYLTILRQAIANLQLTETRVVGGGARSGLWNQIKADVLGVPYQPMSGSEFGTWGAALIAGKAVGIYQDLAEVASRHARPSGPPVPPRKDRQTQYGPLITQYIDLQRTLRDTFVNLDRVNSPE